MKPRILLLAAFLLFAGQALQAQQRKCEMAVTLMSPTEGQVIAAFAQYSLTVRIQNNGPNDLLLGDTLWYNIPTMPLFSFANYILQEPINAGTSKDITLATLTNNNSNTDDEAVNFYVIVRSSPDTAGSVYRDLDLNNNVDSNHITYKPGGPNGGGGSTAINNVSAKELNIVLYPNPATSELGIKTDGLEVKRVIVTDIAGRTVLARQLTGTAGYRLNIATLVPGMYFLKMETGKGIASAKFIKQ